VIDSSIIDPKAMAPSLEMFRVNGVEPTNTLPGAHDVNVYIASGDGYVIGGEDPRSRIIDSSRAVHTNAYLDSGIIVPDDLSIEGFAGVKHLGESDFHLVVNGTKAATARLIMSDRLGSIGMLPTVEHFEFDRERAAEVAGVDNFNELLPGRVAEISSLGSVELAANVSEGNGNVLGAARVLYASLLRSALDNGHTLWMQNIDGTYDRILKMLLGKGHAVKLGPEQPYMGPPTFPMAVNPTEVLISKLSDESGSEGAKRDKQHIRSVFGGHHFSSPLPDSVHDLMKDNGIEFTSDQTPKVIAFPESDRISISDPQDKVAI
jgi:hypothetical protein